MSRLTNAVIWILVIVAIAAVFLFFYKPGFLKDLSNYNPPKPAPIPGNGELNFLQLPDGFSISIFARDLKEPRVIIFDPKGRMLVSETKAGRIAVLEDKDKDGVAETKATLRDGLRLPHGLAFYTDTKTNKTYLYIAETHQVSRFEYNVANGLLIDAAGRNIANLPAEGRHFTRTIAFGPNYRKKQIISGRSEVNTQVPTKLYISVGSSCDVCLENTWKRAAILESDPEGNYTAEFAGGLRNAVFFALHPETKEIWATEMGRDNLGDDLPPDEINIVKAAGEENKFGARRYGWPFCYGNRVKDTTFRPDKIEREDIPTNCAETEPPAIEIPAHSAPLGLAFVPSSATAGGGWPKEWRNNLLVAYHGSWNRSVPTGYKIVRFDVDKNGRGAGAFDFVTGWLTAENKVVGRPVDLKFGPDGALYISDDSAGVIYRVVPVK